MPARAFEATPAYPESPATSQAPGPNLTATAQARTHPKSTPAYPDSTATSQARNSPLAPRRQLSYEPFEPLRDQVRRDGINALTSHPPRKRNEPPDPAVHPVQPPHSSHTPRLPTDQP